MTGSFLALVTGIPATESQTLRTRADYADYQRTPSVLVPRPPRTDAHDDRLERRVTS
jgi:steroid 5-alpha reductase family enzyme